MNSRASDQGAKVGRAAGAAVHAAGVEALAVDVQAEIVHVRIDAERRQQGDVVQQRLESTGLEVDPLAPAGLEDDLLVGPARLGADQLAP